MNNNLEQLRELMRSKGVEAVIIPGTDPHQSEYVSDYWKFRDWLSGFTGSNGTAVVTLRHASMWTDSRYFLQADIELEGSGFELQNVDFTYPNGVKALHDVSMCIEPDKITALVGVSGAGKSTIVNLLDKFYQADSGTITLDGTPLSEWDTRWVREHVGLVLQKNHIFDVN